MFCCRANAVTFVDLVIANCTFDGTKEAQSVIEVSKCHDQSSPGLVNLRDVAFRKNRLIAASLLRVSASSCSDLEMIDVEIEDNVCSGDGCGVFLGRKTNLENCTAIRNRVVKSNRQMSSLVYAPALSNTTIQGFSASRNELTIVRVQDGVLSLSNASFIQNSLKTKRPKRTKTSCIHSVNSSVAISKCGFTANEGYIGSVILAEESNVSVSSSFFWNNSGSLGGGCVFASKTNVKLKNTTATNSRAEESGGFMYAEYSNVTLENTKATNNSATFYGGFMYVVDSNVTLENTKATNNSPGYGAGFMHARDSNVTLKNTKATNNSARRGGGFMYVVNSTVTLENTKATNNSVGPHGGGFMYADSSNVTLENTKATNTSSLWCGGFLYAYYSNVTLKNTSTTNNTANSDGGFMYAKNSSMSLENTLSVNSSAKSDGGFMYAENSTVTLENTSTINNSAGSDGGFMYADYSNVTLENTSTTNNTADSDGGFMYAKNSSMSLENTLSVNTSAKSRGGFLYAENSNVTLENTSTTNNRAESRGGFVYAKNSSTSLENTLSINASAESRGGFLHAENSTVKMENTSATNSLSSDGGFMYAENTTVSLENTSATNTSAVSRGGFLYAENTTVSLENTSATNTSAVSRGGFLYAENSNVTLENTSTTNNRAGSNGAFMYAENSTVKVENASAIDGKAKSSGGYMYVTNSDVVLGEITSFNSSSTRGGFVYVLSSRLKIMRSRFRWSKSRISGGFAVLKNSSVWMNDSELAQGSSKNGGAMWLKKSNLTAHNLSISHCQARSAGGGVMCLATSAFLCSNCKLENNSVEKGNGGAIFFDARYKQGGLRLQLVRSRVENNVASLGGRTWEKMERSSYVRLCLGGIFFVSSEKNEECVANGTNCPFMALTDTKFSGNKAEVAGGAVFAGYIEAIRFDCSDASSDARLEFYEEKEWKALSRLESEEDICPSWRGNHGNVYGSHVGTYAAHAKMTFEKANRSICVSGGDDCVIDGYRTSKDLPKAEVKLLDAFGQGPARNYRTVNAIMSSVGGKFMVGSVIMSMEEGNCTFLSIRGFVPPGEYKLTVEFGEEAIKDIGITVMVRNCSIGETVAPATEVCQECSNTTYNFDPSARACWPCPENGNCETRVITPDDGYWQKTPCSKHIHRCLPTSSCKREGRTERLTDLVRDVTNCSFNQSMIESYTQAQCAEASCTPSSYEVR